MEGFCCAQFLRWLMETWIKWRVRIPQTNNFQSRMNCFYNEQIFSVTFFPEKKFLPSQYTTKSLFGFYFFDLKRWIRVLQWYRSVLKIHEIFLNRRHMDNLPVFPMNMKWVADWYPYFWLDESSSLRNMCVNIERISAYTRSLISF